MNILMPSGQIMPFVELNFYHIATHICELLIKQYQSESCVQNFVCPHLVGTRTHKPTQYHHDIPPPTHTHSHKRFTSCIKTKYKRRIKTKLERGSRNQSRHLLNVAQSIRVTGVTGKRQTLTTSAYTTLYFWSVYPNLI